MDSDEDDDFVQYGTPLEPLEDEDFAPKKPRNDQTVRDEQGRRRFHGAFTGGFSAGYFNTVGTKEGWAPSTFVSSRSKKAGQIEQRPEDFMDAEDFGEYGIAPRRVQLASKFADESRESGRKRAFADDEGPIPGTPPLRDLIKPVNESIGVRLLQKMGWRPGQGVGPRIKRKEKSAPPGKKVYGCMLPPTTIEDEDDPYALAFTFAPEDVSVLVYTPKDNLHGIGYKGLDRTAVLSSGNSTDLTTTKAVINKDNRKLAIRGQAFGVGAFEEEDEDIYAKEDMSMYDFALDDGVTPTKSGEERRRKGKKSDESTITNALEGFHLARKKPHVKKHFPPPTLPPDFRPVHKPADERTGPSRFASSSVSGNKFLNRHAMTTDQRGSMLGENFRPAPPSVPPTSTSVFDLISPRDKERLQEMQKRQTEPSVTEAQPTLEAIKSGTFKPFARDPEKQKRYETYLALSKAGRKDALQAVQPPSMTEWEKQRERAEFQRAAMLYRPLSSGLNTRFVSSSAGLEDDGKVEVPISEEGDKSDQIKAAEMKLYGKLTRETFPWHPASLLCKRFNVPNPYPDSSLVGLPKVKKDKCSIFNFLTFDEKQRKADQSEPAVPDATDKEVLPESVPSTSAVESSTASEKCDVAPAVIQQSENKAGSTSDRPPMDLFKAIFASSSEESSSESEDEDEAQKPQPSNPVRESQNTSGSVTDSNKRQVQPSFAPMARSGVFANLDLDAINSKPPSSTSVSPRNEPSWKSPSSVDKDGSKHAIKDKPEVAEKETEPESEEFYGPKLPPTFIQGTASEHTSRKQEPKTELKHERRHSKHKHKKKTSKKKKKHRHRKEGKRGRRQSSESESDDSSDSEDVPTHAILDRLKQLKRRT